MANDEMSQMSRGFADPKNALRIRDTIRKIAIEELGKLTGKAQVGRVMTVTLGKLRATVWFPGDPAPVEVNMFSGDIPNDIGDERDFVEFVRTPNSTVGPGALVVVEPYRGQPYVTQVLSGGQFAYDLSYAGLKSKIFNTTHIPPDSFDYGPAVQGTMTNTFSFFIPGFGTNAFQVGPFVSLGAWGESMDGEVRVQVSQLGENRTYHFNVNQWTLYKTSNGVTIPTWMRLIPIRRGGERFGNFDLEPLLDIAIKPTTFRDPNGKEIWLRFSSGIPGYSLDFLWATVESFGPILSFGDPVSGKIISFEEAAPVAISGYIGFHDANHGQLSREDMIANGGGGDVHGYDFGRYPEAAWSTGPFINSDLRVAELTAPQLGITGPLLCDSTGVGWTGNITVSGIGPSRHGLYEGRLNLPMPANGTLVGIFPSTDFGSPTVDQSVTVTGGRIPLAAGQTLCFSLPPSIGNGTHAGYTNFSDFTKMWFIVDSETYYAEEHDYKFPQWGLPIVRRGIAAELVEYKAFAKGLQDAMFDSTSYYSTSVGPVSNQLFAATTEAALFVSSSFKFKDKCAYRVKLHVLAQITVTTTSLRFRFRKGTTAAGTIWHDFGEFGTLRNAPFLCYGEGYLYNSTGADITTQTIWTGQANVANNASLQTNTNDQKRWGEIEYCGPADKYTAQGFPIT